MLVSTSNYYPELCKPCKSCIKNNQNKIKRKEIRIFWGNIHLNVHHFSAVSRPMHFLLHGGRHFFQRWFHVIPTYIICSISWHKYHGFTVAALEMSTSHTHAAFNGVHDLTHAAWVLFGSLLFSLASSKWLVGRSMERPSCKGLSEKQWRYFLG